MTDAPATTAFDLEQATIALVMARLRAVVNAEMERIGIQVDPDRVLSCVQVRNELIRHEYNEGRTARTKSEALIVELSSKYGLSYESVNSIVHDRR